MSTRLKLSKEISAYLDNLSNKLGLRRNIICRLAIGRSLVKKESVKEYEHEDSLGYELNRTTVAGNHDALFRALITQHEGRKLNDFEYFSHYLRNHIERGVELLVDEYGKINSPVEFLVCLVDFDKQEKQHLDLFQKI